MNYAQMWEELRNQFEILLEVDWESKEVKTVYRDILDAMDGMETQE